jgi:hypothetical protein
MTPASAKPRSLGVRLASGRGLGFLLLTVGMLQFSSGAADAWFQDDKTKTDKVPVQVKPAQPKAAQAKPADVKAKEKARGAAPVVAPAIRVRGQQAVPAMQMGNAQLANLRMFEEQITPQVRQLYRSELHLLRIACQLTKPEFDRVAKDGEEALKATVKELAKHWNGQIRNGATTDNNPRAILAKELMHAVQKNLSPEQAKIYQNEIDLRAEAQKRTIVNGLVAKLDGILMLNADQRVQIEKILKAHWKDYMHEPRILMAGNRFFPRLPDDEILAVLSEAQKDEWNRLPKGNINYGLNLGMVHGFEEEEVFADEVARPAPAPVQPDVKDAKAGKARQK